MIFFFAANLFFYQQEEHQLAEIETSVSSTVVEAAKLYNHVCMVSLFNSEALSV